MMRYALLTAALLVASPASAQMPFGPGDGLVGRASVVDGDTIEIRGIRIRLDGADAVESGQRCLDVSGTFYPCGQAAASHLDRMLQGRVVRCDPTGRSYDRVVASCSVDGRDLAEAMVLDGWAVDVPRYSQGRYAGAQASARAARRGIWQGEFQDPADYRHNRPRGSSR